MHWNMGKCSNCNYHMGCNNNCNMSYETICKTTYKTGHGMSSKMGYDMDKDDEYYHHKPNCPFMD